jgi:toxin ParE1/3/4
MVELTWTVEAERWLRDIYDYIALDNPSAAARTIETIYRKAEILREFPESGYRYWLLPVAISASYSTDIIASPT